VASDGCAILVNLVEIHSAVNGTGGANGSVFNRLGHPILQVCWVDLAGGIVASIRCRARNGSIHADTISRSAGGREARVAEWALNRVVDALALRRAGINGARVVVVAIHSFVNTATSST